MTKKWNSFFATFGLLLASQTLGTAPMARATTLPALQTLEGQAVQVQSNSRRVLVYVWATWCTTCLDKMTGLLPEWLNEAPKGSLDVVLLNTDKDMSRVKHYIAKNEIKLRSYQDQNKALLKQIRALSVPHWAVYEQQKKGDFRLVDTAGGFDEERVKRALQRKI